MMAKAWMKQDQAPQAEALETWNTLEAEFNEERKAMLMASAESDKIKDAMNKKYGPGTMKYGSEISQPPQRPDVIEIDAINAFMKRNPAAEGGRIGFYKAGFVEGQGWKVKFASKSTSPGYPDKFIGTQYYPSEEAANAAIEERKIFSQKNIEIRDKKNVEMGKAKKAEYKNIIDDFIEKGDYENFKTQVYESSMGVELPSGKQRRTTGGRVPPHIIKFIRDRLDAGPGTELFEELKEISGRTEEELLDFKKNIPEKGYISPKDRSQTAIETSGVRKSDAEKLDTEQKAKRVRAEKEAVGTKYASNLELENIAKIKTQIADLNKMFKNKPELINTPQYAKMKEMMEVRIAPNDLTLPSGKEVKAGEIYFREKDSKGNLLNDDYYIKKAKSGNLFSFFDINKVGTQMGKFATNANITPGDFNSAFIQGQVEKFFTDYDPQTKKPGKFYGDTEKLKNVDNYLKSVGVKLKISGMDKRIGGGDTVFFDSKTGDFPHIKNTLNIMGIQNDNLTTLKASDETMESYIKAVGCPTKGKAAGGRIGFSEGTDCFNKGQKLINNGMKGASPASMRNFGKFANNAFKLGRNVMRFGVIPEALFIGAESLVRMGMGDTLSEASKQAVGFYLDPIFGTNFKKEGAFSKMAGDVGAEMAFDVSRLNEYKESLSKIEKLKSAKEQTLAVNDESLTGQTDLEVMEQYDKFIADAQTELNKRMLTETERVDFENKADTAKDVAGVKSPIRQFLGKARSDTELMRVEDDFSGMQSDMIAPEVTQKDLNKNMLPQKAMTPGLSKFVNFDDRQLEQLSGLTKKPVKELRDYQDYLNKERALSLLDQEKIFGKEQTYGTQGNFFGEQINKKPMYDYAEGGITTLRSKYEYKK